MLCLNSSFLQIPSTVLPIIKTHKVGINKTRNIQCYEKLKVREPCINSLKVNRTKPTAEKSGINSLQIN